jgi:hypothetical protein
VVFRIPPKQLMAAIIAAAAVGGAATVEYILTKHDRTILGEAAANPAVSYLRVRRGHKLAVRITRPSGPSRRSRPVFIANGA